MLKDRLTALVRRLYRTASADIPAAVSHDNEWLGYYQRVDYGAQVLLRLKYKDILQCGNPLPSFDDVQFRSYSQNGEDGILLFIFSLIGTTNKCVVEICAGDGQECNAANLIISHGWKGILFDGDDGNVKRGREFYYRHRDTSVEPPVFVHSWVTRDNVNTLIAEHAFGEIDLLSIDLDGNDYWVWEAINVIQPRVIIVEHNSLGGADVAKTIPYDPSFVADLSETPPRYLGATLPAFVKLMRRKGYRLVGGERLGFNAFFIRAGIADDLLPEVAASAILRETTPEGLKVLSEREFVEV